MSRKLRTFAAVSIARFQLLFFMWHAAMLAYTFSRISSACPFVSVMSATDKGKYAPQSWVMLVHHHWDWVLAGSACQRRRPWHSYGARSLVAPKGIDGEHTCQDH